LIPLITDASINWEAILASPALGFKLDENGNPQFLMLKDDDYTQDDDAFMEVDAFADIWPLSNADKDAYADEDADGDADEDADANEKQNKLNVFCVLVSAVTLMCLQLWKGREKIHNGE
jgi:hypothetical protein